MAVAAAAAAAVATAAAAACHLTAAVETAWLWKVGLLEVGAKTRHIEDRLQVRIAHRSSYQLGVAHVYYRAMQLRTPVASSQVSDHSLRCEENLAVILKVLYFQDR